MDPLHFCIAIAPLGVYVALLGVIHLMRRPFVTTGARDAATLAIGVAGLFIVGPMELFFPEGAAIKFGMYVWLFLIAFYGLCVSLVVLLMRPRLVVYNTTIDQFRPILAEAVSRLDPKARWSGESLLIPSLNIHLHLEGIAWLRNVQLVSSGSRQCYEGWRKLENELRKSVKEVTAKPNALGIVLLMSALLVGIGTSVWMVNDKPTVAKSLKEILRR